MNPIMLLVAPGSLDSLGAHLKLPPHPFTVETRSLCKST